MEHGPLTSPLVAKINARMDSIGGTHVRHAMSNGKATFWVTLANGSTTASDSLHKLAAEFGITTRGVTPMANNLPTDLITAARAANITGYSATRISYAGNKGEIKAYAKPGMHPRYRWYSRAEVTAWGEAQKKKGGQSLPRRGKPRTPHVMPAPTPAGTHPRGAAARITGTTYVRLQRYLKQYDGTPMEITPEQFVDRVVAKVLDDLKA